MKFFKFAAAAVAFAVASGAHAQNLQLNQAPPILEAVTSQWVIDLFAERGFTATLVEQAGDHDTLEVRAPAGGVFYVAVRACDNASPKQCSMLQTFAVFDGTGVTLNHINNMVRDSFVLSYAFLAADGNGVIASKVFLTGGVTENNIVEELSGYFYDLDNLIESIQSGQLATVNFEAGHEAAGVRRSKIDNAGAAHEGYVVNAVGPNAPKFLTDEMRALAD